MIMTGVYLLKILVADAHSLGKIPLGCIHRNILQGREKFLYGREQFQKEWNLVKTKN
jgi:hypothetical protein